MLLYLLLLFTLVPLVELWLLVQLSGVFGFWTTVGVVLATGFVGASLARWQGWQVMQRVQNEMRQGLLPAKALGDGVLILMAGLLLITPGVLTDVVGLSLLVPPVRAGVRKALQLWLAKHMRVEINSFQQNTTQPNGDFVEGRVIDAHVVDEQDSDFPSR